MLTGNQKNTLKYRLKEEERVLENQLNMDGGYTDRDASERETVGELSAYDNHPADLGTELFEREKNYALKSHTSEELEKVQRALSAMEDGTYGVCRECGNNIPYERLEAIPSTLYCVEHTPERIPASDRPVEEDVLTPSIPNSFRGRSTGGVIDTNDSFEEVARFGTADSPQDMVGDYDSYNDLYNKGVNEEAQAEDIEEIVSNDMEGGNRQFNKVDKLEDLEEVLDRKGIDSQMGDVPYKRKDSYLEEDD
ncbi:molecular chaperone DnaK [Bacillus sp. FJAT-27225]|nr:molecular chaperone DnaK [Bacillus sp. FJAT-27225]